MNTSVYSPSVSISNITINQDADGRYCVNDLHKASGNEKRHSPSYWLDNQQTKDLIAELQKSDDTDIPVSNKINNLPPVVTIRGGQGKQGTYVVRELVYSYAMWINPAFHLKVIRTFDAVATKSINPALPSDLPTALRLYADQIEQNAKLTNQVVEMKPKADFYDQVVFQEEAYTFTELFGILKQQTNRVFTYKSFLRFLREQGVACQPNPHAPVGQNQFKPRIDYLQTWFICQPTPAGGVEWLIRPIAVTCLVRMILDKDVFENNVENVKRMH